jgi:hypothetical protein
MRDFGARSCRASRLSHPISTSRSRTTSVRPRSATPRIRPPSSGVRALEFPRWFVCQHCRRLGRPNDVFEPVKHGYQHMCRPNKPARAIPVRFVSACRRGHLSDFPWIAFAHHDRKEGVCERPELYLYEGATGDLGKIRVRCKSCDSSQPHVGGPGPHLRLPRRQPLARWSCREQQVRSEERAARPHGVRCLLLAGRERAAPAADRAQPHRATRARAKRSGVSFRR